MRSPNAGPEVGVDLEPLLAATRVINAVIVTSLATVDDTLTVPQLRVMVILRESGPANLSRVAAGLSVNPSNASRTCDQLVKRGLVVREDDAADRRRLSISLSPAGQRLLRRAMDRRRELLKVIVGAMPLESQQMLMTAMESFNAAAATAAAVPTVEPASQRRLAGTWPADI